MEIKQYESGRKGAFYVEQENEMLAEMAYVWAGSERIIINHTEVNPKLQGKGMGKQLVKKAVEFAREKNLKITPLCPFAKAIFDKVKEFSDVL